MDMGERPPWASRIAREREARGWSQAQAVANLRAMYQRANDGKEGGSADSLLRQWKDWEAGRVKPGHWARYAAATFGTVADDLFPPERQPDASLSAAGDMDTAELIARLSGTDIDSATLDAARATTARMCTEYRYRPTDELRIEAHEWLRRITRMLDQRLTDKQHGEVLSLASHLALLVGCVEYDAGDRVAAETTRRYALELGTELDDREVIGWAHEMAAWFALTQGDYGRAIAESTHGIEVAGSRGVSVQLAAQAAKSWARLGNGRQVEVALDTGRGVLEDLPRSTNPDHHFVIDPTKWHFYEMDAYRNVGNDALAQVYAQEVLRYGTTPSGEERSPMRNAEARITLGVVAARAGDIDAAVTHGRRALVGARRSLPSLVMVGQELAREFSRLKIDDDSRVREFRAALSAAASL